LAWKAREDRDSPGLVHTVSTQSSADEDGVGEDSFPLPGDASGGLIMTLVRAADRRDGDDRRRLEALWLGASCGLFLLTISTQFLVSWVLMDTSIQRGHAPYSVTQAEEMAETMRSAAVRGRPLAAGSPERKICERTDVGVIPTYLLILVIWFMHMTDELASATWLLVVIRQVASSDARPEDSEDSDSGHSWRFEPGGKLRGQKLIHEFSIKGIRSYQIRFLSTRVRRWCYLVALAKMLVRIWVLCVGTMYIVFADETRVLVLKTLVCSFFLEIDGYMTMGLMSDAKLRMLRSTMVRFHPIKSEDWSNYGSTCVRVAFVVLMSCFTWFRIFHAVRSFRYACLEYMRAFPVKHPVGYGLTWFLF